MAASTPQPTLLIDGSADGVLPPDADGLLLGVTVFDTLRSYGRTWLRADQHLDRLEASARWMGLAMPDRGVLLAEAEAVRGDDFSVRITLVGGGHRVVQGAPVDPARVARPVRVAPWPMDVGGVPGFVKHGSRGAWVAGARRLGVEELILVDPDGHLLEASRSNVVGVVGGTLVFPPADGRILDGVTRSALLDAAERAELPFAQRPLHRDEPIDELYVASTLKELAPVVASGGLPSPGAGPLGRALHQAFRRLVQRECAVLPAGPLVGDL